MESGSLTPAPTVQATHAAPHAMIDAVHQSLPQAGYAAAAGLYLMVTFDATLSDVALAAAAARGEGAARCCGMPSAPTAGLLLGAAAAPTFSIGGGTALLARALRRVA